MQEVDNNLKKYLLGMLSEKEMEEIDLRVISDAAFAEELFLAEHELIEEKLEGLLSAEEVARFESEFLVSPRRLALAREILLLKEFAGKKRGQVGSPGTITQTSDRTGFFRSHFKLLLAFSAILTAILLISVVWTVYIRDNRSPLEQEYSALNHQDLSEMAKLGNYYPINLTTGTYRAEAAGSSHSSENFTGTVLFRLALPTDPPDGTLFMTEITHSDTPNFTLTDLHAYKNAYGSELRLLVPRSILQKGQYEVHVRSAADGSTVGTYSFAVD